MINRDTIKKWKKLATTLKTIKAQEMELRKEIASEVMQGCFGTVNQNIDGYKVKAQQSKRYKVDNEALLSLWSDLTPEEQNCVKWVPEIKVRDYKNVTDKDMLNSVVTSLPNTPTLKVEPIK